MSLIDLLQRLSGGKNGADGRLQRLCPNEAEILRYSEGQIATRQRAKLETHFAGCEDCRELLVFLTQFQLEQLGPLDALSHEAVRQQTARILTLIENDERKRGQRATVLSGAVAQGRKGFFISYPQLTAMALVVFAFVAGSVYLLTRSEKPETVAMQALALSTKDERRSEARLSGNLAHSSYRATRDATDVDDLQLQRALNKLKSAESESAPTAARQTLARAHLAFDRPKHAEQALVILNQLVARGLQSAEVFNDLGVAQYQLEHYDDAIANFNRALGLAPTYTEALFNLALSEERAKRYQEAKRDWQQFLNASSDANWKAEAERHLLSLSTSSEQ